MTDKKGIETRLWNQCTVEIDLDDFTTWEELQETVEGDRLLDEEIIYYSNAITYLKENDPSLMDSMELAAEYGFSPENITSEVLASLLKSQHNRDNFSNFEDEITDYYEEIDKE